MTSGRIFRQGMNKNSIMVFACGILLVTCLAGNAQAQNIQYEDHVVINEVEIGDQMQDDWVELYNPTSEAVDIGGWVISSFLKGGQSFTIPSDTVLNPGEFIVYEKHEDWFSFQSALVQIHNDGILVDYTTLIKDDVLDSQTWYRTYDGVKADSAKFWKFGNSTKNASNQITDEDAFLGLEINVDRESYSFGDTASITGKVSKIVTDPAAYDTPSSMTLIISGLGSEQTISLYPDNNNLEFKYDISLQPTLGFEFGTYTITPSYVLYQVCESRTSSLINVV